MATIKKIAELLTPELIAEFKKVGYQGNKKSSEIKIICKFYLPNGECNWYAYEYFEDEKIFIGFVSISDDWNDELGCFSIQELQECFKGFGLRILRDQKFGEHYLSELLEGKLR